MIVIVLDGNENQAVACTRSLARAGHRVIVGAASAWSKAAFSRHCVRSFQYPSPERGADSFVQAIIDTARRFSAAVVLPMTERSTLPLSANRDALAAVGARLPLPPHETVLRAFDKSVTTRIAQSLGVAVPRTCLLETSSDVQTFLSEAEFPVVLKPRSSQELGSDGRVSTTGAPIYASSPDQLFSGFEQLRCRATAVLAQEFIPGSGAGYFALMRHGELRAEFAHRRIRDVRPTGSGSAVRVSVHPLPALRAAALRVLEALRWHGVAMVEFRVRSDGTPVFLEVNGRFWNSLALAVHSGVDFPALLVELALHGDVDPVLHYREGTRCRWLLGDFRHLVEVLRGAPPGYPGAFPSRLRTIAQFFTPVAGTHHDNFSLGDPLPEVGDWLDFFARRIPAYSSTSRSVGVRVLNAERRAART